MKVYIIDNSKDIEFERKPEIISTVFWVPFSHEKETPYVDALVSEKGYVEIQLSDRILRKLKTRELEVLEEENVLIKIENKKLRSEVEDVRSKVALLYGSLKEEWRAFYD